MEQEIRLPHKVVMEEREKLTLTGARSVLRFDEEMAQIDTVHGAVVIHGSEMKLKTLSLESGTVAVTGHISAVIYEEPKKARGIGRLFG